MIIVDASLAAKIVVAEADSMLAEQWLRDRSGAVQAPDLIAIEVAQAVVRKANARQVSAESAPLLSDYGN